METTDFGISALAGGTIFVDGGEGSDKLAVDPHGAAANVITNGIAVPFFSQSTTYMSIEAVTVVAPILHLPDDMTVEATSADGAVVEFTATAEDTDGASPRRDMRSGLRLDLPAGRTTVNCSATDASGNTTTGSFTVTVTSSSTAQRPSLHLPDDMTVEAAERRRRRVEFTATANDAVDGPVAVACDPASGSTFPVGTTTVNCTATDRSGNKATGSFTRSRGRAVGWSGFLQPINADDSSVFKLKSTVPVRFALTGDSAGITDLAAKFCYAKVSNGVVGDVSKRSSTSAATTGNLFRYDPTSGQYIFNWGTKGLTRAPINCTSTSATAWSTSCWYHSSSDRASRPGARTAPPFEPPALRTGLTRTEAEPPKNRAAATGALVGLLEPALPQQAAGVRQDLRPVLHVELPHDLGHVVLHGARAQVDTLADLLVREALRHQGEDLDLSRAQRLVKIGRNFERRGGRRGRTGDRLGGASAAPVRLAAARCTSGLAAAGRALAVASPPSATPELRENSSIGLAASPGAKGGTSCCTSRKASKRLSASMLLRR